MPQLEFHRTTDGTAPTVAYTLVGKSSTIKKGDILVLTTNATYTPSWAVARPLLSGDTITAAVTSGIYGVADEDFSTDANAAPTLAYSSTIDTQAQVVNQFQTPQLRKKDSDSGYYFLKVLPFDARNIFRIKTESSDVADLTRVGTFYGITATGAAATDAHTYVANDDAADANAPLIMVGADSDDALYNSSAGGGTIYVKGRIDATSGGGFCQFLSGGAYA